MCDSKCFKGYKKIRDLSFEELPKVPYNAFNDRFLDSFDNCMMEKVVDSTDEAEICLRSALTNCERAFRVFFEQFQNLFNL